MKAAVRIGTSVRAAIPAARATGAHVASSQPSRPVAVEQQRDELRRTAAPRRPGDAERGGGATARAARSRTGSRPSAPRPASLNGTCHSRGRVRPRRRSGSPTAPASRGALRHACSSTLGVEQTSQRRDLAEWDDFGIAPTDAEQPVTRGLHIAFAAPSQRRRRRVLAGRRATPGYRDDGAPGPRPRVRARLLRRLPARPGRQQHRGGPRDDRTRARRRRSTTCGSGSPTCRPRGASTRRSRRTAGLRLGDDEPDRRPVPGRDGSFSLRSTGDRAPSGLHLAFAARRDDATVDAFHARRDRRRPPRQRRAGRAARLPPGLLRRVRARPRRPQRRGRQPQPLMAGDASNQISPRGLRRAGGRARRAGDGGPPRDRRADQDRARLRAT